MATDQKPLSLSDLRATLEAIETALETLANNVTRYPRDRTLELAKEQLEKAYRYYLRQLRRVEQEALKRSNPEKVTP